MADMALTLAGNIPGSSEGCGLNVIKMSGLEEGQDSQHAGEGTVPTIWVWLKINQQGLRRFWSIFPLTRVPFWYRFFEPQPFDDKAIRDRRR